MKFIRRKLAAVYWEYGRGMVASGEIALGREKLLASIKINPWRIRPYIYLAGSVLGSRGIKTVKSWREQVKHYFTLLCALVEIKRFGREHTLNELLNFVFNEIAGLIKPNQVRSEISELIKVMDRMKPKAILEIGTGKGGTLFLFCRIASEDGMIISIDLPGGEFGGGYSKPRKFLYRQFAQPLQKMHFLMMDSHKRETLDQVKTILGGKKLDLLFIDGDHTYEGVKSDFEMYSCLVRQDGIIAFHDIVPGPSENVGGVPQFWRENKDGYRNKEIVESWNQEGYGIGLLYF
jgi:predicted O-methyltransferase YrrM